MKHFFLSLSALFFCIALQAQPWDTNVFNHLSVGVSAGTTGVGADVAMPVCKFLQLRAGFSKMPEFSINSTLDVSNLQYIDASMTPQSIPFKKLKVQGKPNLTNALVMLDILPIPISSFHLTVGAYFGASDVIQLYNLEDGALADISAANAQIEQWNALYPDHPQQPIGLELGDYLLAPDAQGNLRATFSTKSVRPYAGVGIGRAVPRKRIGFRADVGCMFWGQPSITCNGVPLTASDIGGNGGNIIRIASKIKVYPCINIRLCGRIF